MAITDLHISGYRSVRDLRLRPGKLVVLAGPNGCGKTNIYRAITWLSEAAKGRLARAVVDEGGMPSVHWAGERTKGPVRVTISARIDEFEYSIACGLPIPGKTMFNLDPDIKEERLWFHGARGRTSLLERNAGTMRARDENGMWVSFPLALSNAESAISELREPQRFPVVAALRQEMLNWRFYHQFRTDREAPLRHPRPGCRTPVLDHDGHDLAAALQTIREIGDRPALEQAVERAFPGQTLDIISHDHGLSLEMRDPSFQRPFAAPELSDGTLQYLCLLAALLSPRPPAMLALNEPESSLHPDLIEPLAYLIVQAAERSQVWVTTHAIALSQAIERISGVAPVYLSKVRGETCIASNQRESIN